MSGQRRSGAGGVRVGGVAHKSKFVALVSKLLLFEHTITTATKVEGLIQNVGI